MSRTVLLIGVVAALLSPATFADEEPGSLLDAARQLLQESVNSRGGGSAADILSGIGSFLEGKVGDGGGAADILTGIGSLLGGGGGSPGLDPALIGHLMDMFSKGNAESNEIPGSGKSEGVDWDGVLGAASDLLGGKGGGRGAESLIGMVLSRFQQDHHSHHEDDNLSEEDAEAHRGHHVHSHSSTMLPPFLDNLYDMWEHFSQSQLGKTLWASSGLDTLAKLFTDPVSGRLQPERVFASLENPSFRRRWIRSLSVYVAQWAKYIADVNLQARYMSTVQMVANNFLQSQGYPRAALFDPARPSETLSALADTMLKRTFGLQVNSITYVKPAVSYIQELIELGKARGLSLAALGKDGLATRLEDTLNGEVIEPVLRVWRAYRYAIKKPDCAAQVICTVNRAAPAPPTSPNAIPTSPNAIPTSPNAILTKEGGSAGLRPGVTRLSSMLAAWFLSENGGPSFWKLYDATVDTSNCQIAYPGECGEFHEEDIRATTEYAHSEL